MGGVLGGKGGGAPAAPDFSKAAMTNSSNPLGGRSWTQGADGRWNVNSGFTGQAGDAFSGLMGGMQQAASYDPTQARDAAIASNYNQATSRLDPMWAQRQGKFNSGMANQGLDPGSEAYNNAFGNESRAMNDAYSSAMAGAIEQGNRTQLTQMEQMRQPFQNANTMMQMLGQQGPTSAPFAAAQAQYGAAKDAASAQQAGKDGLLSGIAGVGGTLLGGPLGGMAGSAVGGLLGGGGGYSANDLGNGFDPNLGGYNF